MIELLRRLYQILPMVLFFLGVECYSNSSAAPLTPPLESPISSPNGTTAFVGSIDVIFSNPSPGSIFYSLNGLPVSLSNYLLYSPETPIKIEKTTTLRAVRNYKGQLGPETITQFTQAIVSSPIAKYGTSPNFYPSVLCTLNVFKINGNTPLVHYTLDGSDPNSTSTPYTTPILFKSSTVLKAYATLTEYQDSPPISVNFNLVAPPSAPVATPPGGNFSTKSLMIKFLPQPSGVVTRYSTNPNESLASAKILASDSIFVLGNNPGDSILLRAQSFNQSQGIASPVMTGLYTYAPPVAAPTATGDTGFFYDSTSVTLITTTPSAIIRYTLDGSPVTKNSATLQPIPITETTKITAVAFKDNQPNSAAYIANFTLRLTPPTVNPPGPKEFADVLNVKLTSACPGAKIFYTLDGKTTPTSASTPISLDPNVPISVNNTTLMAIVIKGAISSPVSINLYTKTPSIFKLSSPVIEPLSREFYDSLSIHIRAEDSTAQIRYTLDGSDPTSTSTLYQQPFEIKEYRNIKAQAFQTTGNSQPSLVRQEIFTQLPSPPIATPKANSGPFQNNVDVSLTSKNLNGKIFYCLGAQTCDLNPGTLYHPGEIISINSNTHFEAKTVLGTGSEQKASGTLVQDYEVYTNQNNDTLAVGSLRTLSGGFEFANTGATPIQTMIHSSETLGITGFKDAEIAILIQTVPPGKPLHVIFNKPPNTNQALYQVVNGSVRFVTGGAHYEITNAGDYFIGTDTLPPVISLKSQTPNPLGSTVVVLSVKDNVTSPTCEITSPGLPGGKLSQKPDNLGILTLTFQNPDGEPKALWFQAQAFDFFTTSRLPALASEKIFISQYWASLATPNVFDFGNKSYAWDMAGLPISTKAPIKWAQILKDNPDGDLYAAMLRDSVNYHYLDGDFLIKPGMSFWIGSKKTSSGFSLTKFKAGESDSTGAYRITLHHGWNQISNPGLNDLIWPFSRKDPKFNSSLIKGLYQFDPSQVDFTPADTLKPWKGYFVYYFDLPDTIVVLYSDPSKGPSSKRAATQLVSSRDFNPVQISLDIGRTLPLLLGASTQARNEFSVEDEIQIPTLKSIHSVWSQRGSHHLVTDYLNFNQDSLLTWQVIVSDPSKDQQSASTPNTLRILATKWPPGYQAWALSRHRGLKFRLEEGGVLPLDGHLGDTLEIYAGPLEKLAQVKALSHAPMKVEAFGFNLKTGDLGHSFLNLSLPWKCNVEVSFWSLNGKKLFGLNPGILESGEYQFPFGMAKKHKFGFLKINLQNSGQNQQISQKIAW